MAGAHPPPPSGTGTGFFGMLSFRRSATAVASFDPAQDDELLALDALQAHVADRLQALSSSSSSGPGIPLLSLPFLSKLLDAVLSSDAAFRAVLAVGPVAAALARPPADRLAADLLDRAVKALDVLNAASLALASLRAARRAPRRAHRRLLPPRALAPPRAPRARAQGPRQALPRRQARRLRRALAVLPHHARALPQRVQELVRQPPPRQRHGRAPRAAARAGALRRGSRVRPGPRAAHHELRPRLRRLGAGGRGAVPGPGVRSHRRARPAAQAGAVGGAHVRAAGPGRGGVEAEGEEGVHLRPRAHGRAPRGDAGRRARRARPQQPARGGGGGRGAAGSGGAGDPRRGARAGGDGARRGAGGGVPGAGGRPGAAGAPGARRVPPRRGLPRRARPLHRAQRARRQRRGVRDRRRGGAARSLLLRHTPWMENRLLALGTKIYSWPRAMGGSPPVCTVL